MKVLFTPYIYIAFLLFFKLGFSQQLELKVFAEKKENQTILNNLSFQKSHLSKEQLLLVLTKIEDSLSQRGYLKNKLDSLYHKDTVYTAIFNLGKPLKKITVNYTERINMTLLKKFTINYNDSSFTVSWELVKPFLNSMINHYENNGQSFTQIRLKNIRLKEGKAFADLSVSNNKQLLISKIIVKAYDDFPKSFIKYYLGLKPNSVFNIAKLKIASARIKNLPFAEEIKPPEVLFTKSETTIYLYLKKTQTNTFDGLLGFTSKEQGSGVRFNGYLDINLNNAFNTGESLSLLFKSNGNAQQKFNLKAVFPYAFKSKMTPRIDFNIYKQDTSFVNVSADLELQYPINYNSKIGITLSLESSSNLLTKNTSDIQTYNASYFGLSYSYNNFQSDVLFNENFSFKARAQKGVKNSGDIKNNQTKFDIVSSYLWLLNYKNAIFIKSQSALLNTSNFITNELFRIGGFNSIRGFNEESIFASNYSILNLEYRYKTNANEYFYTVSDFGYFTNQSDNTNSNLFSFGLGYLFSSKIGLINISYVLGKAKNQDFKLRNAKFHLSFKANFL